MNIAARLQGEAPPGGIVISRAVREAVSGRIKAELRPLGELSLKNIDALSVPFASSGRRPTGRPEWRAIEPSSLEAIPSSRSAFPILPRSRCLRSEI